MWATCRPCVTVPDFMSDDALFAELRPELADALENRGFTALTPVQKRVLDPDLEGRDLRIASQTGSGKTLAVGFVLAAELDPKRKPSGKRAEPQVLVIAPTRELAAQLKAELGWLFASMAIEVSVVAGGANYRDELRALARGPQLVIGTPGRLLDHLDKGAIDASFVTSVVLDEADQMLDLGFRDELEAILGRVPEERRTHLVSATFSREVLSLAERYQTDALLVEGTSLGDANKDIAHVAHLVRAHDREAAVINLLLMSPNERTLMFVRTRAGASELASRLTEAGFYSLPLSGELEQKERNKTLEAFKSGAVRSLVATDVAARGLDIPDVATVIHFDPPTDLEGLTHRSGRTGRAGKKGKSVLLVPPGAKQRVMDLYRRAGIKPRWCAVPKPEAVWKAADDRLSSEISSFTRDDPQIADLAERLLADHDPRALVEALLARIEHRGPCAPRDVPELDLNPPRASSSRSNDRRTAFVGFRVDWGYRHGADPRRLLAMICRRGSISSDRIGAIQIGRTFSTFEVAADIASRFAREVKKPDPRDRARITPQLDEPEERPRRRAK
jgi:ATP-dependent RNA helicase DeaD